MQTTEAQHWEPTSYGAEVECDGCSGEVPGGEVVVLDGLVYCLSCGLNRAAATVEPLLVPYWGPADIESGRREYEEALAVVKALTARIEARLKERS